MNPLTCCPFKTQDDLPIDDSTIRVEGVTKETYGIKSRWRGDQKKSITIIDTPGLKDPLGQQADKAYLSGIVKSLTDNIGSHNMFLYCIKHDSTLRIDELETFQTFYALFGDTFFRHLVIEITWYNQKKADYENRRKKYRGRIPNLDGMSQIDFSDYLQKEYSKAINTEIKKHFNLAYDIPIVFIDTYHYNFSTI